jgi:hypothetical protein
VVVVVVVVVVMEIQMCALEVVFYQLRSLMKRDTSYVIFYEIYFFFKLS